MRYLLLLLLCLPAVSAATLSGVTYDLELEKLNNVIVGIDTQPMQRVVAHNGTYSFEVPQGEYVLSAKQLSRDLYVQVPIEIDKEGSFVLDLVLSPRMEELPSLDEAVLPVPDVEEPMPWWPFLLAFLIALAVGAWFYFRKPVKVVPSDDAQHVLEIVKREKRLTQKELRDLLPTMSEAKVSLIVSELEHDGKIRKIKKGRGNILIAQ